MQRALRIVFRIRPRRHGRQAESGAQALAIGVGRTIRHPDVEFTARCGPVFVDGAVDARLTQFAAQRDAAPAAHFRTLHTGAQWTHLRDEFHGHLAAVFARQFAAIERHPEMRTACAAVQAWVGVRIVTGQDGGGDEGEDSGL
jgi:hypothetical protein